MEALSVHMSYFMIESAQKALPYFYSGLGKSVPIALNRFPSPRSPARQHQSGMRNRKSDLL